MRLLESEGKEPEGKEPVPDADDGSGSQGPVAKQGQDALARFVQAGRVILTADLESKLQEVELRVFASLDERFSELGKQWSQEVELRVLGSLDERFSELRVQWSREVQEEVTRQQSRRPEPAGGGSQAEGTRPHDSQPGIRDSPHSATKQWPRRTPPAPGRGGKGASRGSNEDSAVAERLKRLEGIVGGLVAANPGGAKPQQQQPPPPEVPSSIPQPVKAQRGAARRPPPLESEDGGCSPDSGSGPVCDSDVTRQPPRRMRSSGSLAGLQSPQSPGSPDPELEQILARRRSISEGLVIPPLPSMSAEPDPVQETTDAGQQETAEEGQPPAAAAGQQDSPVTGRVETDEEAHQPSPPGASPKNGTGPDTAHGNSFRRSRSRTPDREQHHLSVSSLSATTDEEAAPGDDQLPLRWRQRRWPQQRSRSNSSGGLMQDTPPASHREVLVDSADTLDTSLLQCVAPCGTPVEVQSPVTSMPPSPCKKFRNIKHATSGTMSPAISFGTLPSGSPSTVVAWEPAPSPAGDSLAYSPHRLPSAPNLQHPPAAWESVASSPACSSTCPPHSAVAVAVPTGRNPQTAQVVTVLPPAAEVPKPEVNSPTRVQSSPALFRCETAPMNSTITRVPQATASPFKGTVTVRGLSMQSMKPLIASGRTMSRHRLVDDRMGLARSVRQSAASWFTPPRPQLATSQSVHLETLASSSSEPTAGTSLPSTRPLSGSTSLMLSPSVNARPSNDTGSGRWAPGAPPNSGQRLSPSPPRSSSKTTTASAASAASASTAMERVAPRAVTPQRCMTASARNPGSSPPRAVIRTPRLMSPGSN